jgi:hypothetical protein
MKTISIIYEDDFNGKKENSLQYLVNNKINQYYDGDRIGHIISRLNELESMNASLLSILLTKNMINNEELSSILDVKIIKVEVK